MTNASCDITPSAGAKIKASNGGSKGEKKEERRENQEVNRGKVRKRCGW